MAVIMMSPPCFSIEQAYLNVRLLAVVALMVNVYQHLYRVQTMHALYHTIRTSIFLWFCLQLCKFQNYHKPSDGFVYGFGKIPSTTIVVVTILKCDFTFLNFLCVISGV